jgi:glyoxalase family protein
VLWRVPSSDSLAFWAERLAELEVERTVAADGAVLFADPEGLEHELLVEDVPDAPQRARRPDIPSEHALIGFSGVRVHSLREAMSKRLLEDVLAATERDATTLELRGERRGATISFDEAPAGSRHVQGAGSIHHVAWGTTVAEHPRWHERLAEAGVPTTPIIDRHFFHSIYFREPGGILYEIADDAPGFAMGGPLGEMGKTVILPPWLEQHRAAIEERLTPLPDPRGGWMAVDQPS